MVGRVSNQSCKGDKEKGKGEEVRKDRRPYRGKDEEAREKGE